MPDGGFLSELMPVEEESVEKILVRLMQSEDIALKTEYPRPLNVARLSLLAKWLEQESMVDSAALVREFVKFYSEDMVSFGRKGRGEIVRALQERIREEGHSRWTGRELPPED
jgi:hypothetical protein